MGTNKDNSILYLVSPRKMGRENITGVRLLSFR